MLKGNRSKQKAICVDERARRGTHDDTYSHSLSIIIRDRGALAASGHNIATDFIQLGTLALGAIGEKFGSHNCGKLAYSGRRIAYVLGLYGVH